MTDTPQLDVGLVEQWWAATGRHELLLQRCRSCGEYQFYPRAICARCHSTELAFEPARGQGTIETFTQVARAAFPDVTVPYVVARVRLAEGPVMLTNLVGFDDSVLGCDLPVRLCWRDLDEARKLPVFGPAQPSETILAPNPDRDGALP